MRVFLTRQRVAVAIVVVVLLALGAGLILAYPAWSARQGHDARWVMDSDAAALLDYDDDHLLVVDSDSGRGSLEVLDRDTGSAQRVGGVDRLRAAALVPGGVLYSNHDAIGYLGVVERDGQVVWEREQEAIGDPVHTLVAVDIEAGVAVAAVHLERGNGPYTLTAFALADGAPVWTMPDVARVGTIHLGSEPARPPGALRANSLIPVIRVGGYPPGTAAEPATWSLVAAESGDIVAETVNDGDMGMPVAAGRDVAVLSRVPTCADLSLIGSPGVELTWPDGPPAATCSTIRAIDSERVLVRAPRDGPKLIGGDQNVRLFSVTLASGAVTELDWTGTYADTNTDGDGREMTRSWGRYLFSRGTVYDTHTGQRRWQADAVWLASATAVIAEPVSGIDRLVSGASDSSRWLRLADAATGEPSGGGFITDYPLHDVSVLDRGEAVAFAGNEIALLAP